MRNKFLLIAVLFFGIGLIVFAKSQTVTIIPATGLDNAVMHANENSSVACVMFAKHLRYGDGWRTGKQNEVRELQEALREKGYFTYSESTGYFGAVTRDAVKQYQKANGIINTGNVFNLTVGQLKKDFCPAKNVDIEENLSKGPVNSYCKVWNDGCNTCFKSSSTSTDIGCTRMYCEQKGEPYCKEYFKDAPITAECKSWYDGCNWCGKNSESDYAMCTMRACMDTVEPAYCTSYFSNPSTSTSNLIKACPSEKIINLMPVVCITTPCLPQPTNEYYIYNGQRKEISDFDANYVRYYCSVPETKVY